MADISTAPHDGTRIIAWDREDATPKPVIVVWDGGEWCLADWCIHGVFLDLDGGPIEVSCLTDWLPIPELV